MLKKCVTMEVLKSKINSCYCVTGLKFLSGICLHVYRRLLVHFVY